MPRKKGFFSKLTEGSDSAPSTTGRFHIGGRKRGQSGIGEELGSIKKPEITGEGRSSDC